MVGRVYCFWGVCGKGIILELPKVKEGLGLFWESYDYVESCERERGLFWESYDYVDSRERGRGLFWESYDYVESCESGIGGGGEGSGAVLRISEGKRLRGGVLRSRDMSIMVWIASIAQWTILPAVLYYWSVILEDSHGSIS